MEMPDFKRVIRGYDPKSVDQTLAETVRQLFEANAANKEMRLQINSLQEQNSEWGNRLKHFEQIEKNLMNAMLSAQQLSSQVKEEATQQANELIQSARTKSESIINEATRITELKEIETETLLSEKRAEISQIEEQIQGLAKQKRNLQTLVDQSIHYLDIVKGLLGSSTISSEQNSE